MSSNVDWQLTKFGDLVEGVRGVSYQPHDLLQSHSENTVVLLRANNIQKGRLEFDDIQIVPKHIVKSAQFLSVNDIAVCMSNGSKHLVGKSAQYMGERNEDCTVGAFCSIFRAKQDAEPSYIKQLFHSGEYQSHIDFSLAGSAINNLKNSDIESILFRVPPKKIQKKIANILKTIDQAIEKTEVLIEKYQQIKAGLMHDLFTRGIGADGQLRPPREQAPELYQHTPIGWIPKDWEVSTIDMLGGLVTSGSRDWAKYYSDNGDIFVRIGNLTREHINFRFDKTQYVVPPKNADGQRTRLIAGDILVSITADLGIVGVVPENLGDAYINQHIALIRFFDGKVKNRYVGHYFCSNDFQKYVSKLSDSGAKAGLNLPTVRAFPVATPVGHEQSIIIELLDSADNKVSEEKHHLEKLQKQKSGLMHDLLTGKVEVKVKKTEPLTTPVTDSITEAMTG